MKFTHPLFSSKKQNPGKCVVRLLLLIFLLFSTLLFGGCGKKETPEEQIRHFIKAGEKAAEKRDWGDLGKLISENYRDEQKRTKLDLVRVAAGYFLRHDNIHLLTRIAKLTFSQEDAADVILFVAMADLPLKDVETLFDLQADLYRFEMRLIREGNDWQLVSAHWRQARKEDFLPDL